MSNPVKTIEELELLHYGQSLDYLQKADANILTTTGGVFNTIFGAFAWLNLNLEANAFSVLPKYVWDKSGFRIITGKATPGAGSGITVKGGTPEGGVIDDTVKPTIEEVSVKPKIAQIAFGASTVHEWLANNSKDDIWGSLSSLRTYMAVQHKELLNQMLLADVEAEAGAASADYAGTSDWESLDRVISSDGEEDIKGGTYDDFYDVWDTLDRDSATKYDATVKSPSGTIGTNGTITKSVLIQFFRDIWKKGGKYPNVALGSAEVYGEIQEVFEPATRYPMGEATVQVDVNGIKTYDGHGVGLQVTSIYGVPFIPAKDAPSNSGDASEVGRLLAIDTSDNDGFGYPRTGIQIAVPTTYNEATRNTQGWPFSVGSFNEKGVYWTMGELICRRFNGNGKLGDISL